MSKIRTETDFSDFADSDLTWRLRELSDLKRSILDAPAPGNSALLRAVLVLAYAHWEGYIKITAQKYFEFVTIRKMPFSALQPQFYLNSFLARVKSASLKNLGFFDKMKLISDIASSHGKRFSFVAGDLIDTKSSLWFSDFEEICTICCVEADKFEHRRTFVDTQLVKRRHAVAHGQDTSIAITELDELVDAVIELMRLFKNELENKIYNKAYLAQSKQ